MIGEPTFISVDGVRLAVHRQGEGEPVVCLTAIGHDAFDFRPFANRLPSGLEIICIEWPSHGDSGDDALPASAHRYDVLLEGALDQLGLERPILIGNSIGGAAAILCASRRDVKGLVLCNSGGLLEVTPALATICRGFSRIFAAGASGAFWYPTFFGLYYRMVLPLAPGQRRRIISAAKRSAPLLAQAWESFGQASADLRGLASRVSAPVWAAWAMNDFILPLGGSRPGLDGFGSLKVEGFRGGHSPFLEDPDRFAERFLNFLAEASS